MPENLQKGNTAFMKTIVKKQSISKEEFLTNTINSIKKLYPEIRQESKPVTFALQYAGTPHTLHQNSGFPLEEAQQVYNRYHELYKVSAQYAESKKLLASQNGYLTVAFGLRVRTPILEQVIWGAPKVPYEAAAEARTIGNALSQSYGLLNNRAAVAFFKEVWKSPYRYDILPVALIHDAIYVLMKDRLDVVEFVNRELIKAMKWQELPEIQHPTVKLGANLDIFWPDWSNGITLPNNADQDTIKKICSEALQKYESAKKSSLPK